MESIWLGNYFGFTGRNFDGAVYDKYYLSPPILASCCHGNVPKVIVRRKEMKNELCGK